jgi:hypothetical protein
MYRIQEWSDKIAEMRENGQIAEDIYFEARAIREELVVLRDMIDNTVKAESGLGLD